MKSSTSFRFSSVFFFFFFFILFIAAAIAEDSNAEEDSTDLQAGQCVYALTVKTGTVINAGTDSLISLTLSSGPGLLSPFFNIPDLKSWGLMSPGYNYFEYGHLDFFAGSGPCLVPPKVCRIIVKSSGNGTSPSWYLEYVDITTFGPNYTFQFKFQVNQWLGDPFQLFATSNHCGVINEGGVEAGLDIAKV